MSYAEFTRQFTKKPPKTTSPSEEAAATRQKPDTPAAKQAFKFGARQEAQSMQQDKNEINPLDSDGANLLIVKKSGPQDNDDELMMVKHQRNKNGSTEAHHEASQLQDKTGKATQAKKKARRSCDSKSQQMLSLRSKRHLSKWEDHVRSSFVRIYESTLSPSPASMKPSTKTIPAMEKLLGREARSSCDQALTQCVRLDKKEADRFLTAIEVSKVHALFGDSTTGTTSDEPERKKRLVKGAASEGESEPASGCF